MKKQLKQKKKNTQKKKSNLTQARKERALRKKEEARYEERMALMFAEALIERDWKKDPPEHFSIVFKDDPSFEKHLEMRKEAEEEFGGPVLYHEYDDDEGNSYLCEFARDREHVKIFQI